MAGQGPTPLAVAMATDYGCGALKLHRVEIVIRPENMASLRVVEKLGFRREGPRPAYLHIDGGWRDHEVFALNADEVPGCLVEVLAARHESSRSRVPGSGDQGAIDFGS